MALGHSQEGRKRTCGRDQPYHPGSPGHLGEVFTASLWDVEAPGKYEVEEFIRLFYERFFSSAVLGVYHFFYLFEKYSSFIFGCAGWFFIAAWAFL